MSKELYQMSGKELVDYEASLDFNDEEVLEEIFSRAEDILPGITQRWKDAVCNDSPELPDTVKDEALRIIADK